MSTVGDLTPRRINDGQNICLICAFSFIYTEILSTGVKQEVKLLKQKLRLTEERIVNVRKIIPSFSIKEVEKNSGVCVKCYKTVEKGIRMEEQLIKLKSDLNKSQQEVMAAKSSSRTQVEQRLLRSPFSSIQPKQPKSFPSNITLKHPVQLPSFGDILLMTRMSTTTTSQSVFQPNVQLPSTVDIQDTTSHVQKFVAIATAPANTSLSSEFTTQMQISESKKTVRRSLGFSGKEQEQTSPYEGEVKVD